MKIKTISAGSIDRLIAREDILIVDVRSPKEYEERHLRGAVNIPLERIPAEDIPKGRTLIIYCERGAQSLIACDKYMKMGIQAVSVVGGLNAYHGKYLCKKETC